MWSAGMQIHGNKRKSFPAQEKSLTPAGHSPVPLLGPAHTTPDEFENGGFTLKTDQMFTVHTTPEEFRQATITGHFGFVFEENSLKEIT